VRRSLRRKGLKYKKYRNIDLLTEAHFKARLAHAKAMKDFDYKSVLFTDEKIFPLSFPVQGKWCEADEHPIQEIPKWPENVKVWAGVGQYFKTKLYFFDGTMKAPRLSSLSSRVFNR